METKSKLFWLELIGGIIGWVWILAGIATLLLVLMALAAAWSWWNVLWAFLVGAVAKWLTRGFLDNQKRVAYEAHLISKGVSKEEAGKAWIDAYNQGDP